MMMNMTVGELEEMLLSKYPAQDAEPWDRTGVLVGNPDALVEGVAVALDPTVPAVLAAKEAGCNVLLTHHPAFLEAPESFLPGPSVAAQPGALVVAALQNDVALINFHTALDLNEEGLMAMPSALGLEYVRTVQPLSGASATGRGYGALCTLPADRELASVGDVAAWCKSAFGTSPRIWGDPCATVCHVVTAQGSAGCIAADALAAGADCLVCGEFKYHDALAYSQAGMAIIELGHDKSELPLAHALYKAVKRLGVEKVVEFEQTQNWVCL